MGLQSWTGWTKWNGSINKTFDDAQKAAAGGLSITEFRLRARDAQSNGLLDVHTLAEKATAGRCWVLNAADLHAHFGSKVPSKRAIDGGIDSFLARLGKGEAVAVTAWTRGMPTAVLFAGWAKG